MTTNLILHGQAEQILADILGRMQRNLARTSDNLGVEWLARSAVNMVTVMEHMAPRARVSHDEWTTANVLAESAGQTVEEWATALVRAAIAEEKAE